MKYSLRLTQKQSDQLFGYLFHDENESAMLGLCGYDSFEEDSLLLLHKLIPIPYEICTRYPNFMSWPTEYSEPFLMEAKEKGLTIVKFHCHPSNYRQFSETDNSSDKELFDYYNAYFDDSRPVGSFVMVPGKSFFGRVIQPSGDFVSVSKISVIGETQNYYYSTDSMIESPDYLIRNLQTFGQGTTSTLGKFESRNSRM